MKIRNNQLDIKLGQFNQELKGCILPFLKKGDLVIAKIYQDITLTSIAAKPYNTLLFNCIKPELEKILKQNQNGFWTNQSHHRF